MKSPCTFVLLTMRLCSGETLTHQVFVLDEECTRGYKFAPLRKRYTSLVMRYKNPKNAGRSTRDQRKYHVLVPGIYYVCIQTMYRTYINMFHSDINRILQYFNSLPQYDTSMVSSITCSYYIPGVHYTSTR